MSTINKAALKRHAAEAQLLLDGLEKICQHALFNSARNLAEADPAKATFYIASGSIILSAIDETRTVLAGLYKPSLK